MISLESIQTIDEDIKNDYDEQISLIKEQVFCDDEQMKDASNSVLNISAYSDDLSEIELSSYLLSLISSVDFKKYVKLSLIDEKLVATGNFTGNRREAERTIDMYVNMHNE